MIYKILLTFFLIFNAFGSNHEVVARAYANGSFRLPIISYISNSTIKQNSRGEVVFNFIAVIDQQVKQAIWYAPSDLGKGRVIHFSKVGNYLSDPEINEKGQVTFSEYNEADIVGLYRFNSIDSSLESFNDFKGLYALRDPKINNYGDIIFRGTSNSGAKGIYLFQSNTVKTIVEMNDSVHSYIFSASFNGESSIILKTRLGQNGQLSDSRPDEIKRFDFYKQGSILVSDSDSLSSSIHDEIHNTVGSSSNSLNFAFVSKNKNGVRTLYRSIDSKITKVVSEGENGVKSLEYFSPSINSKGHVAFRAIGEDSKRRIFWSNGSELKTFISQDDLIDTDTVTGRIHSANGPSFGGGVSLNENDEVVYQAKVYSKNLEKDLGTIVLRSSF